MAACSLFEEDEVYVEKQGKGVSFGLVLENAEFLSSSEEDEVDKTEDRLQKGTVRVAWHPTGKETVVAEDKVHLIDRSLMPGDVVRCLVPGQDTQCGFVMDMDVKCHLHVLRTNKYIYNVDSKDLLPLQKFDSGQEVLLDSWLGRVETVNYELIIVFPDGARCQVDEDDLFSCEDITEKKSRHGEFSVCLHYPGQELKGSMDCFSDAKWLHSSPRYCSKVANKKGKSPMVYVTVEKIITKNVEVHWIFRGYEKVDNPNVSVNPPPRMIEGENIERLQVLDWFSHCSIQIGDRMAYMVKNDDIISTVIPGKAFNPQSVMTKETLIKIFNEDDNRISEDIKCSSSFSEKDLDDAEDADFEDIEDDESEGDDRLGAFGGRSGGGRRKKKHGHKGTSRHKPGKPNPSHKVTGGKKRIPKERVVKHGEVVEVEIEFTTSWAKVMWQDGSVENDIPSINLFPVHHLDELEFFPGDFVLPNIDIPQPVDYGVVVKADHHERTCRIHWFRAYDVGKATEPTCVEANTEMSVYDIKDHPDYKFRPGQSIVRVGGFEVSANDENQTPQTIGQICELEPNGHLFIKWTDGSISQHFPQEIFIVSDDADDFTEDSWESESDYASEGSVETWETESEQELIGEEDGAKTDKDDSADKDDSGYDQVVLCEHKQELDSLLYRAETALVRLQKHLSNFDVTVSAPECFHDIIRIYRSCHDLDKILQSSFFNDPELQALISQAKFELKRDKPNKISKHLSQLFESWSRSLPASATENVGSVAISGKTIRVGLLQKGEDIEVSIQVPKDGDDANEPSAQHNGDLENKGAMGGGAHVEGGDSCPVVASHSLNLSTASNSLSEISEMRSIKKEYSEPAISKFCRNNETRRPSDPVNETNISTGAKSKKKNQDALVGENCVSKAAKRAKSDNYDDSGREVKKSREEAKTANHVAQELCSKICQNLQKQILRIHEEVNKRTKRLMSSGSLTKNETDIIANNGHLETDIIANNGHLADTACSKETHENLHQLDENNITAKPDNVHKSLTNGGEVNTFEGEELCSSNGSELVSISTPLTSQVYNCGDVLKIDAETLPSDKSNDISEKPLNPETESNKVVLWPDSSVSQEIEGSITLEDLKAEQVPCHCFEMLGEVESFHKYVGQESQPVNPRSFRTAVRKELKLFQSSLPDGIFVKGFENRLDLYSVMILGPEGTPYEDAVFLFDLMLPNDYPNSPPLCHYHSYCSDRLNPNLYEDGKVCVSLLGTWSGKGTEVWTAKSNLLQVLLSIQGLILVSEPYYNEAGYERQRGTQVGHENSRMYNEMAILKTMQSLIKMCNKLPTLFKHEIYQYLKAHGHLMIRRLRYWMDQSQRQKKPVGVECQDSNELSQNHTNCGLNKCETGFHLHGNVDIETSRDVSHQSSSPLIASHDNQVLVDETTDKSHMALNGKDDSLTNVIETPLCTNLRVDESLYNIDTLDSNLPSNGIAIHLPKVLSLSAVSDSETRATDTGNDCTKMNGVSITLKDQEIKIGSDMCTHELNEMPAFEQGCQKSEFLDAKFSAPQFPLFPMSRGFCLTLEKFLNTYEKCLQQLVPPLE